MARLKSKPGEEGDLRKKAAWRWIISAILLLHLVAVILPPLNRQTYEAPFARAGMELAQPYVDAAFLNHGYAFFAPDPPDSSHVIRYRVEFEDGRPPIERTFPDLDRHWPRLLYHRHFMLSEQLRADFPEYPRDAAPDQVNEWRRYKAERFDKKWDAYLRHLQAAYGSDNVSMFRVLHFVPPPIVPQGGINLRDPRSYVTLDDYGRPIEPSVETLPDNVNSVESLPEVIPPPESIP